MSTSRAVTEETLQPAVRSLVQQLDAVTEQLTDVTLLLTGTLDQSALEEAEMLVDQAAWAIHETDARLVTLLAQVREGRA